jgi:hypothetical protein
VYVCFFFCQPAFGALLSGFLSFLFYLFQSNQSSDSQVHQQLAQQIYSPYHQPGRDRNAANPDDQPGNSRHGITCHRYSIIGGAKEDAGDNNCWDSHKVFVNLPSDIVLQKERQEISVGFTLAGAVFMIISVVLSMKWRRFP